MSGTDSTIAAILQEIEDADDSLSQKTKIVIEKDKKVRKYVSQEDINESAEESLRGYTSQENFKLHRVLFTLKQVVTKVQATVQKISTESEQTAPTQLGNALNDLSNSIERSNRRALYVSATKTGKLMFKIRGFLDSLKAKFSKFFSRSKTKQPFADSTNFSIFTPDKDRYSEVKDRVGKMKTTVQEKAAENIGKAEAIAKKARSLALTPR